MYKKTKQICHDSNLAMNQNNLCLPANVILLVLYLQVGHWFKLNMGGKFIKEYFPLQNVMNCIEWAHRWPYSNIMNLRPLLCIAFQYMSVTVMYCFAAYWRVQQETEWIECTVFKDLFLNLIRANFKTLLAWNYMVYMYISHMLNLLSYFFYFPPPVWKVAANDVVEALHEQTELNGQKVFCYFCPVL